MKLVFFIGTLLVGHSALAFGNLMAEGYLDPNDLEPPEEREDTPGAFQSDILLSPEQREIIEQLISEGESGIRKRTVTKPPVTFWPQNILPYEIHISSEPIKEAILAGIAMWNQSTCAQIVPYSPELAAQLGHENSIRFYARDGCASYVGMMNTGQQDVNMGHGCDIPGVVAHELAHSLGRQHEHIRVDRDDYVSVHFENIRETKEVNFRKYNFDTYGIPYDVRSIMHYGSRYFSWNWEPTLVAKNIIDHYFMGNRGGLSFYDIKMGNAMLNCSSHCTQAPLCENEGFVDKNCICVCKPKFIGDLCQSVNPDYHGPEGFYTLTAPSGDLSSPHGEHSNTLWQIVGGSGAIITITFTRFNLKEYFNCRLDYVVIQDGDVITTGADRYCGTELPPNFTSITEHVLVVYTTTHVFEGMGFDAHYVIHPQLLNGDGGFWNQTPTSPTPRPVITTEAEPTTTEAPTTTTEAPTTTTEAPTTTVPTPTLPSTTEVPKDDCENVEGTCGGNLYGSGCFASPNYPQHYDKDVKCTYNIQVASNERVELTVLDMDIEYSPDCRWDYLKIWLGERDLGTFCMCGDRQVEGSFVSLSNAMTVTFESDWRVHKKGFVAKFKGIQL